MNKVQERGNELKALRQQAQRMNRILLLYRIIG